MTEPFIGQIMPVGFNFAPRGWALCDGQLLSISQNSALFALLGTAYGGDGRVTFGLPDLRGRVPVHVGSGPGLSPYTWGQKGGTEQVTLSVSQIPSHSHTLRANSDSADSTSPSDRTLAEAREDTYNEEAANADMKAGAIGNAGGGQGHPNIQPYLAIYWCIALTGLFPSRN